MSNANAPSTLDGDWSVLQAFEASESLRELEASLSQFNIFEAIGATRNELRHSNLLAFLFDPNAAHGLGDRFLQSFLLRVAQQIDARGTTDTPLTLNTGSTRNVEVYRERDRIDILVLNPDQRWLLLIENKIGAAEGIDQLQDYLDTVARTYPDYQAFPVFLTPDGSIPSVSDYQAVDYRVVADAIEEAMTGVHIENGVQVLLKHYLDMLGRHVLSESDIAQRCREIYRQHKRAIDLLIEHRETLAERLVSLLQESDRVFRNVWVDTLPKKKGLHIQFLASEWLQDVPMLRSARAWSGAKNKLMRFQFVDWEVDPAHKMRGLELQLLIGPPGTAEATQHRQTLLRRAREYGEPFRIEKPESSSHVVIYRQRFLSSSDLDNPDDEIEILVRQRWKDFLKGNFQILVAALNADHSANEGPYPFFQAARRLKP